MARSPIPQPSVEYLRECFEYDPETGILTWKERPARHFKGARYWRSFKTRWAGKPAGHRMRLGYQCLELDDHYGYLVHRIAWALTTGNWPVAEIDHIDGNPTNNRLINLREATRHQNVWNMRSPLRKLPRGVSRTPHGRPYRARIGKTWLGTFATPEEAYAAYCAVGPGIRGEFFRLK